VSRRKISTGDASRGSKCISMASQPVYGLAGEEPPRHIHPIGLDERTCASESPCEAYARYRTCVSFRQSGVNSYRLANGQLQILGRPATRRPGVSRIM
jgi:hypothetical protein